MEEKIKVNKIELATKHKYFISGAYRDTERERNIIESKFSSFGHEILDVRNFENTSKAIDVCDIFIIISGNIQGNIIVPDFAANNERGFSLVEGEFRYAVLKRKPIIAFINKYDNTEKNDAVTAFEKQLKLKLKNCYDITDIAQINKILMEIMLNHNFFKQKDWFKLDCFISYSSNDVERVENIINKIDIENIPLWIDKTKLKPAQKLTEKIMKAISESFLVLVFITNESINSKWVYDEFKYAKSLNKNEFILPVVLEKINESDLKNSEAKELYIDINDIRHINLYDETKKEVSMNELINSINDKSVQSLYKDIE